DRAYASLREVQHQRAQEKKRKTNPSPPNPNRVIRFVPPPGPAAPNLTPAPNLTARNLTAPNLTPTHNPTPAPNPTPVGQAGSLPIPEGRRPAPPSPPDNTPPRQSPQQLTPPLPKSPATLNRETSLGNLGYRDPSSGRNRPTSRARLGLRSSWIRLGQTQLRPRPNPGPRTPGRTPWHRQL